MKPEEGSLSVAISAGGEAPLHGELCDVSAFGVGIHFGLNKVDWLKPGDMAMLFFTPKDSKRTMIVNARLKYRDESNTHTHCCFEFTAPQALKDQLSHGLCTLFNQRCVPRVAPERSHPIAVHLHLPGEGSHTARLIDISILGLAVELNAAFAGEVHQADGLMVEFNLPGIEDSIQMFAIVRAMRATGRTCRVGLEFDQERSREFSKQQKSIFRYVKILQHSYLSHAAS